MEQQQYSNHKRIDPLYHYALTLASLAMLIGAIVYLVRALNGNGDMLLSLLLLGFSLIGLVNFILIRRYPMMAQDRAIRAEENLRHYVLTGKLLASSLTIQQIIALRFASDSELPGLAEKAAKERLKPDDIKKSIRSWRADQYRV
jgi:hypothetical protein